MRGAIALTAFLILISADVAALAATTTTTISSPPSTTTITTTGLSPPSATISTTTPTRSAPTTAAIPSTSPATTRSASLSAELDAVEALLASGDRGSAIRRFTAISAADRSGTNGANADVASRVLAVHAKVNEAADALLGEVDDLLAAAEHRAAAERVRELLATMAGLPTGSLARQRLAELVAQPQVRQELAAMERRDHARDALLAARQLRDEGKEDEAYARFQSVAHEYQGTPAGAEAADAVKAFESDAGFVRRSKDRAAGPRARVALNLAENYRSAGRLEQARKKYEEVIQSYPDTSFAETARRELGSMGSPTE